MLAATIISVNFSPFEEFFVRSFAPAVRRYTYNSNLLYHLRILIALIGTTAVPGGWAFPS